MSDVTPANPTTPDYEVAPSPHISEQGLSTRRVMGDVLIALLFPALSATVIPLFGGGNAAFCLGALQQLVVSAVACLAFEWLFTRMRGHRPTLLDGSALITGVILGMSLPATCPVYTAVIASAVGIGIGKVVFGGLGQNIFNPAMVGRAFVMIAFAKVMGGSAYVLPGATEGLLSRATPLGPGSDSTWLDLLLGDQNGSIGEISVVACLIGGTYLCLRRVASWEIPVTILAVVTVLAFGSYGLSLKAPWLVDIKHTWGFTVQHHLFSGALVFGAFYIATDPVTSPMTRKGKVLFGALIGLAVWGLRIFSAYPEGVMFAVLMGNACVPLINRFTVPVPVGGPLPQRKEGGK